MYEFILRIIADGLMVVIFIMAMYGFIVIVPWDRWWHWAWRIVLAGITTYIAARLIGYLYQPEALRPFERLGLEPGAAYIDNPGFPSDHVLFAMFLTLAVWYATRKKWLVGCMLLMTIIMGVGRVLALVHTPLDVVGGMIIPCIGIFWYGLFGKKIVQ